MAQQPKCSAIFGVPRSESEAASRCVANLSRKLLRNPRRRYPSEANALARPAAASRRRAQHRRLP